MPFITSKTATTLSWDAFPPPPPEAESWTPPVDSIPKPGALPDRRFNRDPESDRRSKSFKREKRYLSTGQAGSNTSNGPVPSATMDTSGLGSGLGDWPAPAPRASGYSRDLISTVNSVKPRTHCSATPDLSADSGRSASSSKSAVPAWAAPLEKALAEENQKIAPETVVSSSVAMKAKSKNDDKSSTPQSLKDKTRLINGITSASLQASPGANPGASSAAMYYATLAQREHFVKDEAPAWTLATTEVGTEDAKNALHLHTAMVREYDSNQRTNDPDDSSCVNHGHKVKVMLIRAMEHELDLEKVASEHSLLNMSSSELRRYHDKTYSAHRSWWDAESRA